MKWFFLSVLFFTSSCQSFQYEGVKQTRVILFFKQPIATTAIESTLQNLSSQIKASNIELIRQSNPQQLIVNVINNNSSDWLDALTAQPLVQYAEIDAKKTHK